MIPQFNDFDGLVAQGSPAGPQIQTLTWDFSAIMSPGQTLQGTPVVVLTPIQGSDPDADSRVLTSPQIGTAQLTPVLTGDTDCAVLAQIGNLLPGVKYKLTVTCPKTPNSIGASDVAAGFNHIQGVATF